MSTRIAIVILLVCFNSNISDLVTFWLPAGDAATQHGSFGAVELRDWRIPARGSVIRN